MDRADHNPTMLLSVIPASQLKSFGGGLGREGKEDSKGENDLGKGGYFHYYLGNCKLINVAGAISRVADGKAG